MLCTVCDYAAIGWVTRTTGSGTAGSSLPRPPNGGGNARFENVTTGLHLDPELAEVVERARRHANESGELLPPNSHGVETSMSESARATLADVVADEPELADQ